MASGDSTPDHSDSVAYKAFLSQQIADEEERLKDLQEECRVTEMEAQLKRLRLQSADLSARAQALHGTGQGDRIQQFFLIFRF